MAFWIVWLIAGVIFILAFTAFVIPKIIFKVRASYAPVHVKVTDRFSDGSGNVTVYSSDAAAKDYVKGYRVIKNAKGLFFRGEWKKRCAYAEYELTAYGANDNILDILRVKEKFNGGKYTDEIALPAKTDYVTLRIVCVDDEPIPAERRAFGYKYALWLGLLCVCLAAVCDLLVWLVVTFALRCADGFTLSYALSASGWAMILGFTALGVVALTAAVSLGRFFLLAKEDEYVG